MLWAHYVARALDRAGPLPSFFCSTSPLGGNQVDGLPPTWNVFRYESWISENMSFTSRGQMRARHGPKRFKNDVKKRKN